MRSIFYYLIAFLLLFVSASIPASAIYFESNNNVNLPADRTYNESVFLSGNDLTINSTINGDLFCAGRNITINAPIRGDILCAGQVITLRGQVDGNARLAGQTIDVGATISRNLTIAGQMLNLNQALIQGDASMAGQTLTLSGTINRDLAAASQDFRLNGLVNRNAQVATRNLDLGNTALINGSLDLHVPRTATLNYQSAQIKGGVNKREYDDERVNPSTRVQDPSAGVASRLLSALSLLLLGLIVFYFTPHRTNLILSEISSRPLAVFFAGLAFLLLVPILIILAFISVIAAPLGFVLLLLYVLGLILALVYSAAALGTYLSNRFLEERWHSTPYYLLIGTIIIFLLSLIPVLGFLTGFTLLAIGLGAFFLSFLASKTAIA